MGSDHGKALIPRPKPQKKATTEALEGCFVPRFYVLSRSCRVTALVQARSNTGG